MFQSKLFRNAFLSVFIIILLYSLAAYFFSVPYIKKVVYSIEEHKGKTVLDNVYRIIETNFLSNEAYRKSAIEAHKRELKNVVMLVVSYVDNLYRQYQKGLISEKMAKRRALNEIMHFRYGNNNYVFITDHKAMTLTHGNPKIIGKDMSEIRDAEGNLLVPNMIKVALKNKEGGYTEYLWERLGEEKPVKKLSYSKNIPYWQWMIGTGVYIDDVEKEIARRKEIVIEELRLIINEVKVADTGYMYIFDSKHNMIIHPNENIEGKNFSTLLDPVTTKPIGPELVEIADKNKALYYKWDKPNDPGNYIYDKISWVRYFKEFDWYVASSVYVEELYSSSVNLRNRILLITIFILIFSTIFVFIFVNKLVTPIKSLSEIALKVRQGDLSARSDISKNDEIGILSDEFNNMVMQLETNIKDLDSIVEARTEELKMINEELNQKHNALLEKDKIISQDLYLAKNIQRSILSSDQSIIQDVIVHYQPLLEVGGDIYDIFKVKEKYFRIFLADATGHGIQAALTTMLIKSEYDKIKIFNGPPNQVLQIFNRDFILNYYRLTVFFTCILMDIDLIHKKIYYSSAGHPSQFLISDHGVQSLPGKGKMIGLKGNNPYELRDCDINKGDKIILFTDGLFEIFSKNQEELGVDKLTQIIDQHKEDPIEDLGNHVLQDVNKWRGNYPINDDITLIGIRIR